MRIIADFHLHSKYSRATSKDLNINHIAQWATRKGLDIVGTGDFTHPLWLSEIKRELKEDGSDLLQQKNYPKVRFIISAEISSIYSQGGRVYKIHTLVLVPDIATAQKIREKLSAIGNLYSDGRPILGLSAEDLAKIILDIEPKSMVIPAHIWTPWFSLFGSNSGFNSLIEAYEEITPEIFAVETGLSSDPEMNWRLSALDNITLISNSDAHSGANLAREANVFEIEKDKILYNEIRDILKSKDAKRFPYTIEFFPEEGKYHFDGHLKCKMIVNPFEKHYPNDLCPICNRKLTIGVANRVEKLADRKEGKRLANFPDSKHLVPLREIIADAYNVGVISQKVAQEYLKMTNLSPELKILLDMSESDLDKNFESKIVEGIKRVRKGQIKIEPGYDGVYGKVKIFDEKNSMQKSLF